MTISRWHVLLIYAGFAVIATLLALARRWLRPGSPAEGVWRKYPTYILINLGFLFVSWLPSDWRMLTGLLSILAAVASWEISHALRALRDHESVSPDTLIRPSAEAIYFGLFPLVAFFLVALAGWLDVATWFRVWVLVFILCSLLAAMIGLPGDYARRSLAMAASVIYLPVCLVAYLWIQKSDGTGFAVTFLYLTVATNDAMAQITGELLGRRALVAHISPAKTIEGAAGGIIFAGAMGVALSSVMGWSYLTSAILGLILGFAGLMGDLTASVWKRALGLKNFSTLLGAQGGVLDRFDGLIFSAPFFYLLMIAQH